MDLSKNALILAAGLGTRLRPLTDTMPKALVPITGRPMLEHQILRLKADGFDHIVVNIHHFGQQIIDFIKANDSFGIRIDISDERERLLDTGGAVRQAMHFFRDSKWPVLVHNVDIFSNAPLAELYKEHTDGGLYEASLVVSKRETSRYLAFDGHGELAGWKNIKTGEVKTPFPELRPQLETLDYCPQPYEPAAPAGPTDAPDMSLWAFSGIHFISPWLADDLEAFGEAFSIIDFYLSAAPHWSIMGMTPPGLRLVDAGKPETLPLAAELLRTTKMF